MKVLPSWQIRSSLEISLNLPMNCQPHMKYHNSPSNRSRKSWRFRDN
ncbi:hypothetical protein BDFB_007338 [Asbolus verrucosus]|uniref:Uncharacterized protein n=1 Tax=Asbolus verrucosus TaxID=1661398 RepID=A0A482W1T2_ASBVE|nr:hypothetical protein BDFB_007338 [Asbolus verrucosus]